MSKTKPGDLGAAIENELMLYAQDVEKAVDAAGERAMQKLVRITKATAPKGKRGQFRRKITWTALRGRLGTRTFVWHVKAPDHRLVHLVVHGHATKDGGRTKGNSFLQDALDQVLPEYEREVEEAVRK